MVGQSRKQNLLFGSYQANRIDSAADRETFGVPIVYTPEARSGSFRYFVRIQAIPGINGRHPPYSTLLWNPSTAR